MILATREPPSAGPRLAFELCCLFPSGTRTAVARCFVQVAARRSTLLAPGEENSRGHETGPGGNPAKTICSSQAFTVNCAEAIVNPCANAAPFGEVTGNTHITSSSGVQIQFSGDFGEYATIDITGDNSFYATAIVGRNGDSCNYHVSWKFNNGSGADIYSPASAGVYAAPLPETARRSSLRSNCTEPTCSHLLLAPMQTTPLRVASSRRVSSPGAAAAAAFPTLEPEPEPPNPRTPNPRTSFIPSSSP